MTETERPDTFFHVETRPDNPELLRHTHRIVEISKDRFKRFALDTVTDRKGGRSIVLDCRSSEPDTFTIRLQPMGRLDRLQILAAKRGDDGRSVSSCSLSILSRRESGELVSDPEFDFCSFRDTFGFEQLTVLDFTGETPSGTRLFTHTERVEQMLYPVIEGQPVGVAAGFYVDRDMQSGLFS